MDACKGEEGGGRREEGGGRREEGGGRREEGGGRREEGGGRIVLNEKSVVDLLSWLAFVRDFAC